MSVNPNLATLMGLIDELQDAMPEGKYLEAMNALRDLHAGRWGVQHAMPQPQPPVRQPFVVPAGRVELTDAERIRHERITMRRGREDRDLPEMIQALGSTNLWNIVCREWNKEQNPPLTATELLSSHPRYARNARHNISTETWWLARTAEQKIAIIHEELLATYKRYKDVYEEGKNPSLEVCPFISRHSVGKWEDPDKNPRAKWNCVCGSVNLLAKNWEAHKHSDKHRKWHEEGRKITDTIKKKMVDVACHVRNTNTNKPETFWPPSTVWTKQQKVPHDVIGLKICQGVICHDHAGDTCGHRLSWKQQHEIHRPQSLNEWICRELKEKPWDYKVTDSRVITTMTEPKLVRWSTMPLDETQHYWMPLANLPRYTRSFCPVTRRDFYHMTEEEYAIFISMEE